MTVIKAASHDDQFVWQYPNLEDEPSAETAIAIKSFSDCIELVQDGSSILLSKNKKNIDQIAKALRQALKP